jgi:hypothetical protein
MASEQGDREAGWPNVQYPGIYDAWCGSDELGWYWLTEWGQMHGMNPGDYGYGG